MSENSGVGVREERLGHNEALFREVNERIAEVAGHFIEAADIDQIPFSCECSRGDCGEQISLTLAEYEAVRAEPTHFALLPGHELPEIERVVERHPDFLVAEKVDEDAEEVARETDPRT